MQLGLDTATPFLAIAVWSQGRGVLASTTELVERRHAARLIPALDETLQRAGVGREDLAAIAVGRGPGSYTGLRVGGAAALGLARSLGLHLAGCDTLAAMAFCVLADGEEALVGLDARRDNVYVGRYLKRGQEIVTLDPPQKASRDAVTAQHPHLRLIEEVAPDPGFVARQAGGTAPFSPVYL